MKRYLKLFFLFFIIFGCSLNTNSSLWSKKSQIAKDKTYKIREIIEKEKIISNEINANFKINLSNANIGNSFLKNYNNNDSVSNYNGSLKNISKYKFNKIKNFDQFDPEVIIDKGNIIFFNNKGTILKFNNKSQLLWKRNNYSKSEKKINPILFFSNNKNILIVADTIAKYYAININNGEIIWSKNHSSPFNSQIKIYKDKFYVVDSENILRCFSIINGEEIWKFITEKSFIKSQKKNSIVIKNNTVIFNNTLGDISAVNISNGSLIWQTPTQTNAIVNEAMFLKTSDIIAVKNSILFSNNQNEFFSINAESGTINWKQKINSSLRPASIDNLIFTVTNEGYLIIVEHDSGKIIRSTNIFKNIKNKKKNKFSPVGFIVGKKNIYLSTSNGRLFVVDVSSGVTSSVLKIDNEKISRPAVLGKNLIIVKNNSIIKLN